MAAVDTHQPDAISKDTTFRNAVPPRSSPGIPIVPPLASPSFLPWHTLVPHPRSKVDIDRYIAYPWQSFYTRVFRVFRFFCFKPLL